MQFAHQFPAVGGEADPGRGGRRHQGRKHRTAARLAAAGGRHWRCCGCRWCCRRCGSPAARWAPCSGRPAWAATSPMRCGSWPTCPNRPPRRRSPRTLRSVVDLARTGDDAGPMLSDRIRSRAVIWGDQDAMIPVSHARMAHSAMPAPPRDLLPLGRFPFRRSDRFVGSSNGSSTTPCRRIRPGGAARTATPRRQRTRGLRLTGHPRRRVRCDRHRRTQRYPDRSGGSPSRKSGHDRRCERSAGVHRCRREFRQSAGVVDAATVPPRPPAPRHQVGYSETIFIDLPPTGSTSAHAHPHADLPRLAFAGHPTVGAAWWLAERRDGRLAVPAGIVRVGRDGEFTTVRARADWSPEFVSRRCPRCRVDGRRPGGSTPTTSTTTCGPGWTATAGPFGPGCSPTNSESSRTRPPGRPRSG